MKGKKKKHHSMKSDLFPYRIVSFFIFSRSWSIWVLIFSKWWKIGGTYQTIRQTKSFDRQNQKVNWYAGRSYFGFCLLTEESCEQFRISFKQLFSVAGSYEAHTFKSIQCPVLDTHQTLNHVGLETKNCIGFKRLL